MVRLKLFKPLLVIILTLLASTASAQIGYQVALLDNATGEPRANESVKVDVKLTDSKGNVVCQETKTETTNDFGILSMTIGSNTTFDNVDWANLPFFIEASANGRLIGKSQLLSVPVAEHAKHTGALTKEILCSKKWHCSKQREHNIITFTSDIACELYDYRVYEDGSQSKGDNTSGSYVIDGNTITILFPSQDDGMILHYFPDKNYLISGEYGLFK